MPTSWLEDHVLAINILTEIALGGPEDPLADVAVLAERAAASAAKVARATKALPSPRTWYLRQVTDSKLRNRIEALFRQNAKVGNGGTADAVRHEMRTGELLSPSGHLQKAIEMRDGLLDDLASGRLNASDSRLARELLSDLHLAISGK